MLFFYFVCAIFEENFDINYGLNVQCVYYYCYFLILVGIFYDILVFFEVTGFLILLFKIFEVFLLILGLKVFYCSS
jgi:hypothetical protein